MTDPTAEPLTPKRSRPALFLDELTADARQQRLSALLAEVRRAEDEALSQMTVAVTELNRAIALRERIEHMLERPVRPLSATESAEPASVVGQGRADDPSGPQDDWCACDFSGRTCPRHGAVL